MYAILATTKKYTCNEAQNINDIYYLHNNKVKKVCHTPTGV